MARDDKTAVVLVCELQRKGNKAKVNSVPNPNKYSQNTLANIHQV